MVSSEEEYENEEDMPPLLKIRMESLKLWDEFFQRELQNPEMKGLFTDMKEYEKELKKPFPKKGSSRYNDPTCHFAVKIPNERRRSARLANIPPQEYEEGELEKLNEPTHEFADLEKQVFRPRRSTPRATVAVPILPVEKVTDSLLHKIARKGTLKKYSQDGTSCHQCRQKTLDTKSVCRSGHCSGVRGAFCGVCLQNRYGEDVAVVIKDPNWACPPCRGICNCSICRTRNGKAPTGIMAPIAQAKGHKSVKDFLITLASSDVKRKAVKEESSDSDEDNDFKLEPSPKKPKIKISGIFKKKTLNKHNVKERLQQIGLFGQPELLLGFDEQLNPIFIDGDENDDLIGFEDEMPCYKEHLQIRKYQHDAINRLEDELVDDLKKLAEEFNFIFNATVLSDKNKKLLNIL